mmetsp:Transcript_21619/g.47303  ORF Transcript_21619/g.47303 Transcript_21619/m.47303 type:complete len:334 (-) Transcript_21619:715-1716(-)|eukprot:CAMPEP_0202901614 /NCGR_PEP_ID=MMETSP1392-20130828/14355_1 /ASSEMBLY_ACC=CAM_ASM_000868 /TAXON_ID=225041 /ORGANISM="Chlamydomonas chlamydogama, Strain SAG 11-48b" /LENGTH=333 /DNA_ID=CAMNT_0049588203 /DNA_START=178 /DNA_END=1179 /DNA_ORIENTATION=+
MVLQAVKQVLESAWQVLPWARSSTSMSGTHDVFKAALGIVQQRLLDHRFMEDEFRWLVAQDRKIDHTFQDSRLPENGSLNRYVNVVPYDYNRVVLETKQAYLNASYVVVPGQHSGLGLKYIATQGPLDSTISDFWQMVLEQQVSAVVMLTNTVERGMVKCAPYYPASSGQRLTAKGVQVETLKSELVANGQLTIRTMVVTGRVGGKSVSRTISHYHYHAWPDHGTPEESAPIRSMCEALASARQQSQHVVVHCSAGIGRTGTFVAVDMLRQRLRMLQEKYATTTAPTSELSDALDLPTLVHQLRKQRMGMVQTFEQYVFIYQALYEELAELAH